MATALQMFMIGMKWIISMVVLGFLTFLGGIFQKSMNDFLLTWQIMPILQESLGLSFWIGAIYYVVIALVAIGITYRCWQETITITSYYPEMPM
jgi:hypothetical protein